MNGQNLLVGFALGMAALSGAACDRVECGEGTIEVDGVCQQGEAPGTPECGAGFVYDVETGRCEASSGLDGGVTGVCDPDTTTPIVDDAGVTHCIGFGTSDCGTAPPCPMPSAGQMSICGRILNVRNTLPLDDDIADVGPSETVEVRLYEPLTFADDPTSDQALIATGSADRCGYYEFTNVAPPATGFIAVAVDDAPASGNDDYMLTGGAFPAAAGTFAGTIAWVTEMSLVDAWSTQAGGIDFFTEGVYLPIFLDLEMTPYVNEYLDGFAVSGVQVTETITVFPENDYYFSDTDPSMRETLDPAQNATGPNGSALMINTPLVNHSGTGGEGDCSWPANLSAAIRTVVFVQERHLECN